MQPVFGAAFMEKERIYIYDNLKAVLIWLVVLGHLLEPFVFKKGIEKDLYIFIYSFHMAVLVYCAGVFSSFKPKREFLTLMLPYLFFQAAYALFLKYVFNDESINPLIRPCWLMWFLPCLFVWRFIGRLLEGHGKKIFVCLFCASVFAAICEGFTDRIGYDFSLSRLIYFLPFFLLGWGQSRFSFTDIIPKYAKKTYVIVLCGLVVLFYAAFVVLYADSVNPKQLYFVFSYGGDKKYIMLRIMSMAFSVIMGIFLLGVLPNKKTFFSEIGQRTMCIYLFHGFIVKLLFKYKIYKLPVPKMLYVCVFSVIIVFIFSRAFVKKAYEILLFQKTFNKK